MVTTTDMTPEEWRSATPGIGSCFHQALHRWADLPHAEDMQTAIRDTKLTPEQLAALDRFWADPENEPSKEGKQALAILFGRQS